MLNDAPLPAQAAIRTDLGAIFVSMELSRRAWLITSLSPGTSPSDPGVRICRVAQPLLAFAPTDPTVRRYRSGLFRTDLRRIDHLCQA
jgi:transposase